VTSQSRTERKKAAKKSKIYEVAISLFTDLGLNDVTIEEITETCDVAKGTFFNYYPTKYHVLSEYWSNLAKEVMHKHNSTRFRTARGATKALFRRLIRTAKDKPLLFEALLLSAPHRPELQAVESELEPIVLSTYERIVEIGVNSGEFRKGTSARLVAEIAENLWMGTMRMWVRSGMRSDPKVHFEQKLDVLLDGLRPVHPMV